MSRRTRLSPALRHRLGLAAVGVVTLAWLGLALSLVHVVSANLRLASVFSSDDANNASGVVRMLRHHTLYTGIAFYPGLYFNLSALFTALVTALGAHLEHAALLVSRTLGTVSGAATIGLTGLLARRLSGRWAAGVVAAALVATVPRFLFYSVIVHPDSLQTALMVAALLVLLEHVGRGRWATLLCGSALAGLAFASKYGGVFLVPAIAGAVAVVAWRRTGPDRRPLREIAVRGAGAGGAFAGAFLLANPDFVLNAGRFLRSVRHQAAWHAFGHMFRETRGPATWFHLLGSEALLGPVVVIVLLASPVLAFVLWRRRSTHPLPFDRVFAHAATASVAVAYLGFLLYGMRDFKPRFVFPAVPFVAALAAALLFEVAAALGGRRRTGVATSIVAAWAVVAISVRIPGVLAVAHARRAAVDSPRLAVGRWLADHVPPSTPLVYDFYTYVPPVLRRAHATWGLRPGVLERWHPQAVVTNGIIRPRFADPANADVFRLGRKRYLAIHQAYGALEAGTLDGFVLVARFPRTHTRVYARPPLAGRLAAVAPGAEGTPPR